VGFEESIHLVAGLNSKEAAGLGYREFGGADAFESEGSSAVRERPAVSVARR